MGLLTSWRRSARWRQLVSRLKWFGSCHFFSQKNFVDSGIKWCVSKAFLLLLLLLFLPFLFLLLSTLPAEAAASLQPWHFCQTVFLLRFSMPFSVSAWAEHAASASLALSLSCLQPFPHGMPCRCLELRLQSATTSAPPHNTTITATYYPTSPTMRDEHHEHHESGCNPTLHSLI